MSRPNSILLVIEFTSVLFILAWISSADIVHHTLHVYDVSERKLCKDQVITTVNGTLPGPTIYAREGDTLIVHVVNKSPHNMTIHW
ncbi:hypothetical protein Leryth_025615 [Lithospermum erythrorhizon]|nr:hypothetical protein Leryth_025615 [Lithospermum erythrorhizon]